MKIDELDKLGASAFQGYLVRKDLVRKYSRQYPVPTYVVEFLLGRYCATIDEKEIEEGLQIVERQLKDRTVRTGEEELFKARAREKGSVKLIDIIKARLDAKNDCFLAELPSLALKDVRIEDKLVHDNERMLTDGFYAEVTLTYDAAIAEEKNGRPFAIESLRPIQLSKPNVLDTLEMGRQKYTLTEWIDFLMRSIGFEPSALTERAKWVTLLRMIPFVERNYNMVELGPFVPTDFAVFAPDLRRQSDGGEDVREQCQRPARTGLPLRRGVLRRSLGHFLRPEGWCEHHEGLYGVGRIFTRQGKHPRLWQLGVGRQFRRGRDAATTHRAFAESAAAGNADGHGLHGSHPLFCAGLGFSESERP